MANSDDEKVRGVVIATVLWERILVFSTIVLSNGMITTRLTNNNLKIKKYYNNTFSYTLRAQPLHLIPSQLPDLPCRQRAQLQGSHPDAF
jgi:hypothetical protein